MIYKLLYIIRPFSWKFRTIISQHVKNNSRKLNICYFTVRIKSIMTMAMHKIISICRVYIYSIPTASTYIIKIIAIRTINQIIFNHSSYYHSTSFSSCKCLIRPKSIRTISFNYSKIIKFFNSLFILTILNIIESLRTNRNDYHSSKNCNDKKK